MKYINKFLLIGLLFAMVSCGDALELDELLVNPNSPTPETADLPSLYNQVQLGFRSFLESPQGFTMQLSRQRAMTAGLDYQTAYGPGSFNGIWNSAYSGFIPDADAAIALATPTGQNIIVGSSKIMKAYVLMTLVDLFGDVPLTESGQGLDLLSPNSDDGASVYAAAGALLVEAIAELEANTAAAPAVDLMLGGDADKWIKAAKSLQLRAAVTTRDNAAFDALLAGGGYITSSSDDWDFIYGSNRANPDSRHPFYRNSWETGDGSYQSNWLMWTMENEKAAPDPRIRGYFYRQVGAVPLDNINRFDCIFSVLPDPALTPAHYLACNVDMPYCVGDLAAGYYGRDHGNGNGIPPDGDIRTVYGVYPGGGKFDNSSFDGTQNSGTDGALGAGIHPIMPKFLVDFYIAEMHASRGEDVLAKAALLSGVDASIDKVINYITSRDAASLAEVIATNPVLVIGADFVPTAADVTAYVDEIDALFDASADKLDVVSKEFLIASYGNGLEGFNLIRRTGRPLGIQPAILTSAGTMTRSALYPQVHVDRNANATQKSHLDQVFWDNATLDPCFN